MLLIKNYKRGNREKVRVRGEEMQEVDKFCYLGVMKSTDGGRGGGERDSYSSRGKKSMGDYSKSVEREHNIQRSKMGII